MPKWILSPLVLGCALLLSISSRAADGVIEINQSCVAGGCFAGDTAGFPVTISQPGSYRLTSNLSPTTAHAADGIFSSHLRTRVRGGAVVGMGGSGLQLDASCPAPAWSNAASRPKTATPESSRRTA
jgi:hypothetical protein